MWERAACTGFSSCGAAWSPCRVLPGFCPVPAALPTDFPPKAAPALPAAEAKRVGKGIRDVMAGWCGVVKTPRCWRDRGICGYEGGSHSSSVVPCTLWDSGGDSKWCVKESCAQARGELLGSCA